MAEKHIDRYQGLLLPGFTFSQVAAKGAGATDSAYTQAGPRPGVPVPTREGGLTLVTSGEQGADGELEVFIKRAGVTGGEEAGYLWRDVAGGDSTSQFKGWDPYHVVTGWHEVNSERTATATTVAFYIHGIQLQNGNALFLETQVTATKVVRLQEFDPVDDTWTTRNGPTLDYETSGGCLVQLPSGRVLLYLEAQSQTQVDAYYSDDDGATWAEYSLACLRTDFGTSNDKSVIRVGYSGGQLCMIAAAPGTTDEWYQYASDDDGTRFTLVAETWNESSSDPSGFDLIGLPDSGGFVMSYFDDDGATPYTYKTRKVVSAYESLEDVAAVALTVAAGDLGAQPTEAASSMWIDEDGFLYCIWNRTSGARYVVTMRSTDEAATWEPLGMHPTLNTGDGFLKRFSAVPVAGRLALMTRWEETGDTWDPYSVGVLWLGGYGTHNVPAALNVSLFSTEWGAFVDATRLSFVQGDNSNDGGQWLPYDLPHSGTWLGSGGGSFALTGNQGTFTDLYAYTGATAATADSAFAEMLVKRPAAGAIKLELRLVDNPASATSLYDVRITLTNAGALSAYDINASAAIGSDVTGLGDEWYRIRVALDDTGALRTWYVGEEHVSNWHAGPHGSGLTSTPSNVNNHCVVGTTASGADVDVKFFGFCFWPYRWSPEDLNTKIAEAWSNPDSLHPRSVAGRPTTVYDGLKLRGVGGIAHKGDKYAVPARHDYALELAFPEVEPSRARAWRSRDTSSDVLLVFDRESVSYSVNAGTSYLDNVAVGAFVIGGNFRTFYFEGYDGAAWQTLGTADASDGHDALGFTRNGSRVRPSGGTATAERYLFNGAHVGDTFDLGGGEVAERYHKITANSEGTWTAGTARKPVVTLDKMTGSEVGSGTGRIWARDFGTVVHDHTDTYELYRIRIPTQATADGYFTGKVVVGEVYPFGHQHDRGWTVAKEQPFRDAVLRNGRRRRTTQGPRRRIIDIGWTTTAVDASRAYLDQTSELPDYIVPGASEPGATPHDTVSQVEGILEAAGGLPVVFLRRVESGNASENINRRADFVYGLIVSDGTQRDNVLGDESHTPLDRLNPVRIEELT
jgi:hypothetical protein